MSLQIKGKVIREFELNTGTGKKGEWKNKKFLITYGEGAYPKQLLLTAWNETVEQMENVMAREATFSIEPSTRENDGKYFTDVKVWKVN